MTLRRNDDQEVRELLALRPTDDLTDDERRRVDEALRYSEDHRRELADYERCLAVLHAAAEEPSPTDFRPTLWPRLEPRLGPARRFAPRRVFASIPTSWLTAAVFLLAVGNLYLLTSRPGQATLVAERDLRGAGARVATQVGPSPTGETFVNNRHPVLVDPRDEKGRVRPLLGVLVVPCEGNVEGIEVQAIFEGTSAEDAGLQVGDVLLEVDGEKIREPRCLGDCLKQHRVGQRIELVYRREGRKHKVNVFLGGVLNTGDGHFLIKKSKKVPIMPLDMP